MVLLSLQLSKDLKKLNGLINAGYFFSFSLFQPNSFHVEYFILSLWLNSHPADISSRSGSPWQMAPAIRSLAFHLRAAAATPPTAAVPGQQRFGHNRL